MKKPILTKKFALLLVLCSFMVSPIGVYAEEAQEPVVSIEGAAEENDTEEDLDGIIVTPFGIGEFEDGDTM